MAKLLLVLAFGVLIFGTNSPSSASCAGSGYKLLVANLEILADSQMKSKEQTELLLPNQMQYLKNMEKTMLEGHTKSKEQMELLLQNQILIKQHQQNMEKKILEVQMNVTQMKEQMKSLLQSNDLIKQQISNVLTSVTSCRQLNSKKSGRVWLRSGFEVYCEQEMYNGGWIVIMNKLHGSSNFNKTWTEYKRGFGDLDGEFWLGLDKIHQLTSSKTYEIVIHGEIPDAPFYIKFSKFAIGSEEEDYIVNTLGEYNGTIYKSVVEDFLHQGVKFSTHDNDNYNDEDVDCFSESGVNWWHDECYGSLISDTKLKVMIRQV